MDNQEFACHVEQSSSRSNSSGITGTVPRELRRLFSDSKFDDDSSVIQLLTRKQTGRMTTRNSVTGSNSSVKKRQISYFEPSLPKTVRSTTRKNKKVKNRSKPKSQLKRSRIQISCEEQQFTEFQVVDVSSSSFDQLTDEEVDCQDPLEDHSVNLADDAQWFNHTDEPQESSTQCDKPPLHLDEIDELKQGQWLIHKVVASRDGFSVRIVKEFQTKQAYVDYMDDFPGEDLYQYQIISSNGIFCDFSNGQGISRPVVPKVAANKYQPASDEPSSCAVDEPQQNNMQIVDITSSPTPSPALPSTFGESSETNGTSTSDSQISSPTAKIFDRGELQLSSIINFCNDDDSDGSSAISLSASISYMLDDD